MSESVKSLFIKEVEYKPGVWVAKLGHSESRPRIARVKELYVETYQGVTYICADLIFYEHDGTKIGRESPAMGGPTSYEPFCGFEEWVKIVPPDFERLAGFIQWGYELKRARA